MRLYYSTYGLKALDIFAALPRLRDMGYEGVEIAAMPGWPTDPPHFDAAARTRLAALLAELHWPTPPLMALLSPCLTGAARPPMLAQFEATFDMARQLRLSDDPPVVCTTLGHPKPPWEEGREQIVSLLREVADMAAARDVLLAIEPHAGSDFETPEKAAWLMQRADHPHLGLNFDYSHFQAEGLELPHCIDLNLPYAVHNHLKEGRRDDEGRVRYLLPGAGELDLVEYVQALRAAGWRRYLCPEVSAQIWRRDDYDPWRAAQFCYEALDAARRAPRPEGRS